MVEKAMEKINEYDNAFDDSFPTYMFMDKSDEEVIEIVDSCIKARKDVYELGYLEDDDDIIY